MAGAYSKLEKKNEAIAHIHHAIEYLEFDQLTIMPPEGAEARAGAMAELKRIKNDLLADPELGDLIDEARGEDLDEWQSANVEDTRRLWVRERAVPADLVVALSRAASRAEAAWREAYKRSDWSLVSDELAEVVSLTRERGAAIGATLGCDTYEALLDEHEPGLTRAAVDALFAPLRDSLPPLIDDAIDRQPDVQDISGPFPIDRQEAFAEEIMRTLAYDPARGVFTTSMHPFTTGTAGDVRLTTRYSTDDFFSAHYGVVHELGHWHYQNSLPAAYAASGQPVGQYAGVGMHEGMSLIFEKRVGRSDAYLEYVTPVLQRHFAGGESKQKEWQTPNIAAMARRVGRTFIRVEADEITYPLHILLRYDLEKAMLLDGSVEAKDVPEAWDQKMQDYLGLSTIDDDRRGPLQDIHWFHASAGFTYFVTYTIGALIAAQLFDAALRSIGDLEDHIRTGNVGPLLDWLREHVYGRGRSKPTMALVADATGAALSPEPFLRHLRARYAS